MDVQTIGVISQKRLKIEFKLLLSTNRKSYMPRRLAQRMWRYWMVISRIARYLCGRWASCVGWLRHLRPWSHQATRFDSTQPNSTQLTMQLTDVAELRVPHGSNLFPTCFQGHCTHCDAPMLQEMIE